MRKHEIRIGAYYYLRLRGTPIVARIERAVERTNWHATYTQTHWLATNLLTDRTIEIKSATKLVREIAVSELDVIFAHLRRLNDRRVAIRMGGAC